MATRTVTFALIKPDGTAWAGGRIAFNLSTWSYSATEQHPPATVPGLAGADGTGSVALWASESESARSCTYTATLPDGSVTGGFSVPAGVGSIALSDLLLLHGDPSAAQATTLAAILAAQWKGAYAAGTAYNVSDLARATDGSVYICIQAGTGHEPSASPTYWTLYAASGDANVAAAVAAEAAARTAADTANTSISGTPDFLGQLAVVAGVGYLAVGVSSSSDWKQVTT